MTVEWISTTVLFDPLDGQTRSTALHRTLAVLTPCAGYANSMSLSELYSTLLGPMPEVVSVRLVLRMTISH
jgi:hypothetical protein